MVISSIVQHDSVEDVPPSDSERKKVLPPKITTSIICITIYLIVLCWASGDVQTQRLPVLDIVISGLFFISILLCWVT